MARSTPAPQAPTRVRAPGTAVPSAVRRIRSRCPGTLSRLPIPVRALACARTAPSPDPGTHWPTDTAPAGRTRRSPRGLPVQAELPDPARCPAMQPLGQARVADHQFPAVQHVVGDQPVQERLDLGAELSRLAFQ